MLKATFSHSYFFLIQLLHIHFKQESCHDTLANSDVFPEKYTLRGNDNEEMFEVGR